MKKWVSYLAAVAVIATCGALSAFAQQNHRPGFVVVPESNTQRPEDIGVRAHTNFLIFVPDKGGKPSPQTSSPSGETPQSLSCVYGTWAGSVSGCPLSSGSYNLASGGSNVIAIVDAYDYPTACSDFNTFSSQFGLPKETSNCINQSASNKVFNVVYASGSQPRANCGWAQEEALDIEWAHAMAPNAKIILVEAASNSNNNLLKAIQVANTLVANGGGGQVSMSWGGGEFSTESSYDPTYFNTPKVTYFASSGDTGGTQIWPSVSANVISAGGTHVSRDSNGNFTGETVWSGAGGGPSKYVPAPLYQQVVSTVWNSGKGYRGTPDISFDADPYSGVSVFDSTSCQGYVNWMVFGGTSVSSPSLAGIANSSGAFNGGWDGGSNANSTAESLYSNYNTASNGGKNSYSSPFYDVTSGSAGSYSAGPDWDYASGIGTIRGLTGFAGGSSSSSPSFSVSASPSSLTVTQGQTTSTQITVTPANAYTGTVSFGSINVTGCPTNASCQLSASSVTINSTSPQSVTLNITGTSSAQAGSYNLSVTGTDSSDSSLTSSTTVPLTVNAPVTGSFSLSASPTTASISPKGSASFTITVNSSGFSGSVSLTASGSMPQGRASFSVNPVTVSSNGSATSTLTVSAGPKTPTGPYQITVTGTSGTLVATTTVNVAVN